MENDRSEVQTGQPPPNPFRQGLPIPPPSSKGGGDYYPVVFVYVLGGLDGAPAPYRYTKIMKIVVLGTHKLYLTSKIYFRTTSTAPDSFFIQMTPCVQLKVYFVCVVADIEKMCFC